MLLQGAGVIVSVETVHGRFQFINAPEEEPTMVARLPQQVLLLLVLGEWNTISIYIPVFVYIYIYIFRLGPTVFSLSPSSEPRKISWADLSLEAKGSRVALLPVRSRWRWWWWFFADRGFEGDSRIRRWTEVEWRLGRNEWHRANSNIPISIAERWNYEFNYRRNSEGMGKG